MTTELSNPTWGRGPEEFHSFDVIAESSLALQALQDTVKSRTYLSPPVEYVEPLDTRAHLTHTNPDLNKLTTPRITPLHIEDFVDLTEELGSQIRDMSDEDKLHIALVKARHRVARDMAYGPLRYLELDGERSYTTLFVNALMDEQGHPDTLDRADLDRAYQATRASANPQPTRAAQQVRLRDLRTTAHLMTQDARTILLLRSVFDASPFVISRVMGRGLDATHLKLAGAIQLARSDAKNPATL